MYSRCYGVDHNHGFLLNIADNPKLLFVGDDGVLKKI